MSYGYAPIGRSGRFRGLTLVVALHVALGWLLVSGTAQKTAQLLKKSLEAVVIQEVIIPPPPPPPPKEIRKPEPKAPKIIAPPPPYVPPPEVQAPVAAAPAIMSVPTPPIKPVVIAPPPLPALPAPVAQVAPPAPPKPAPIRPDMQVACPTQITPEMPRKALQGGIEGVVRVQALIKDGVVKEVTILSGPRVFHEAVRTAMLQYKCTQNSAEITATQEFNFKIE